MNTAGKTIFSLILLSMAVTQAVALETGDRKYNSYLYFLQGEILLRQNDPDAAQYKLEKTIELDRNAVPAYKELVFLYLQSGNYEKARMLVKTLKNLSDNIDTKLFLGTYYVYAGDTTSAINQYQEVIKKDPENAEAIIILAGIYSEINPEKSLGYWDRYIALKPDSGDAYYRKAVVLKKLNKTEGAKKLLQKAIGLQPDDLLTRVTLAEIYESEQDYILAGDELYYCAGLDKNTYGYYIRAGEMYMRAKDYEKAERVFKEALPVSKNDPVVYFWLGLLYENRMDWKTASEYVEKSLTGKSDIAGYEKLSYYYTQLNDVNKTLKTLEQALKLNPKSAEVNFFLGLGYMDLKKNGKAEKYFLRTVDLDPNLSDAYFYLGTIYEQSGKFDKALPNLRKVVELTPKNAVAMNYLGYCLADRDVSMDEAETLIRAALEIDPENSAYRDSLGWVYFKRGKYQEAKMEIEQASKNLKDPVVFEHLGDIEKALGNKKNAESFYKKALFLEPKNKSIKKKIKELKI
ncbi:MAG: tetratricopeptide repeat protein [Elusimicrobia bacterium]|nr:tetratricopeptide repeat protein [Elusimicrobiota bacterium]